MNERYPHKGPQVFHELDSQKREAVRILTEALRYYEHDGHDMPKRAARDALIALGVPEGKQPS